MLHSTRWPCLQLSFTWRVKALSLACGGTTIVVFSTLQMGDVTQLTFLNVVVRLENSHSFNASLDNHSIASGPAWCRRCRPPGNAVSGHSSTMCLVVWWLSLHGKAGDGITPHRWRDLAHLAWLHLRRFRVTNWRLGRVNPGCGYVGSVTISCPGGTPRIHDCSHVSFSV